MNEFVDISKVYIDNCEFGFGVFAKKNIKEGDVIENGLMTILKNCDGNENPSLYTWSDDRKTWAYGSGLLPYYNHSEKPNIKKVGNLLNNTIKVVALRDIMEGEELRNTYMSKKWRRCFQDF